MDVPAPPGQGIIAKSKEAGERRIRAFEADNFKYCGCLYDIEIGPDGKEIPLTEAQLRHENEVVETCTIQIGEKLKNMTLKALVATWYGTTPPNFMPPNGPLFCGHCSRPIYLDLHEPPESEMDDSGKETKLHWFYRHHHSDEQLCDSGGTGAIPRQFLPQTEAEDKKFQANKIINRKADANDRLRDLQEQKYEERFDPGDYDDPGREE